MAKKDFFAIFRRLYSSSSKDSPPPESLPAIVSDDEQICRFIFDEKQLKLKSGIVSQAVFLPSAKTNNTSVYRIDGCDAYEVWNIGANFVEALRSDGKRICGRAETKAIAFRNQQLDFDANGTPHFRHADIIGWPSEKFEQKMKALEVARVASLHIKATQ